MNLDAIHDWFFLHPDAAGIGVFLIAMAESLAVIGLAVPGVAMMFVAGALIGAGALSFLPICGYAVAGAIAGDGLSFWLGWRYRDHLLSLWPFSRYPELVNRGIAFFRRHGGWSVLFGRFVGPVRAVIPLVAGMLEMPVRQFIYVNVLSALLWAPAYLLPGMAVGASLDIASQIAGRLAALVAAAVAALWLAIWVSRQAYRLIRPRAHRFILLSFDISRRHPLLGRLTTPLIDPQQRDYPGLLAWAGLLSAAAWMFLRLMPLDPVPVGMESGLPPMVAYGFAVLADLGRPRFLSLFAALISTWLLYRRLRLAAAHFLLAFAFGLLWSLLPERFAWGALADGSVIGATVVYGFTALLAAYGLKSPWRWTAFALATVLAVTLALARVFGGQVELLGVTFSLLFALLWLVLTGVAFHRHRESEPAPAGLAWLASMLLACFLIASARSQDRRLFVVAREPVAIGVTDWLNGAWQGLPARRTQAIGRPDQPLILQWAAPLTEIAAGLDGMGWRVPARAGLLAGGLGTPADLGQFPVLPHFDRGHVDAMRLVKRLPGDRWLIMRIWPADAVLLPGETPVWVGGAAFLEHRSVLGLLSYGGEARDSAEILTILESELRAAGARRVNAYPSGRTVLLISPR